MSSASKGAGGCLAGEIVVVGECVKQNHLHVS